MKDLIFLIDDDAALLKQLRIGLERAGYEVMTALDGKEALQKIKGTNPAAIVLDLNMPHLDGQAFLTIAKGDQKARKIPILVLTGRQDYEAMRDSLTLGANMYLRKPIEVERLLAAVQKAIGRSPTPDPSVAAAPSPVSPRLPVKSRRPAGSLGKVLLIDDDVEHLRTIRLGLIRAGYQVDTARDGKEGIARMGKKRPKVIILDLDMPGMGGLGFLKIVKEHPAVKDIPVIVLTGHKDYEKMRQVYEQGSELFLSKPVEMPKLIESIQRVQGWRA